MGELVVIVGLTVFVTLVMLAPMLVQLDSAGSWTALVHFNLLVLLGPNAWGSWTARMPWLIVVMPP